MRGGTKAVRRRRRWIFAAVWVLSVMLLLAVTSGYFALRPERLRGWIQAGFDSCFRDSVLKFAEPVEVDLWRMSLAVNRVRVEEAGGELLVEVERLALLPRLPALLRGRFEPKEVVLEGPSVRLERLPDGSWNLARFLQLPALTAGGEGGWRCPRVRLRGGKVFLRRSGPGAASPGESLGNEILLRTMSIDPGSLAGRVGFRAEVLHPLARRLTFSGSWDQSAGMIECQIKASKVDLAAPTRRFLGEEIAAEFADLHLEGLVDLEGRVRYDLQRGLLPFEFDGKFIRCQLAPPGLPFPVKGLRGSFSMRGTTLSFRDLEGTFGDGRITGSSVLEVDPALGVTGVQLAMRATTIPLDHRLRARLDPHFQRIFDQVKPQGTVGVEFKARARFPGFALEDLTARVSFNEVGFTYRDFPYPFERLRGEALLENGRLTLTQPLVAKSREATLTIAGGADLSQFLSRAPGGQEGKGDLSFKVRVEKLPVDEELREALSPGAREVWDDFQPAGQVELNIVLERASASESPSVSAFVNLQGVRMAYRKFPYEVTGITGQMHFELSPKVSRVTFADLRGEHGGQLIGSLGVVEWGEHVMFRVDLRCDDLGMDEALKAAFPSAAQRLLEEFNFKGRARTQVTVHSTPDGGAGVNVEVDLLSGSVAFQHFPYPLSLGGGHLSAIGEHSLRLSNVVTRALRPDGTPERPKVVFNGTISLLDLEQLFDFHFRIEELDVDDRLRAALPPDLRRFVTDLNLEGTFRGELSGNFARPSDPAPSGEAGRAAPKAPRSRLVYRAERVSASDAAVDFGMRLRRMDAEGEFSGGTDEGGRHFFSGGVRVKSTAFNRLQLRDADITFAFGKEHPLLQALREGRKPAAGDYRPGQKLLARLTPARVHDSFQMLVRKSDLYGGNARGFLVVDVGKEHDLAGEFEAQGVQVAKAAPDIFGVSETRATGEARGKLEFSGVTGDARSLQGSGEGFIEKARLAELPLFMGLWGVLSGEFSAEHYFNSVTVRFGIREGAFRSPKPEGIMIESQGLRLKGGGTLDFDGKLDLSLTPSFLKVKIPILDGVMSLVKKGLAQVWVSGDISRPDVRFVTGAGLLRIPINIRRNAPDRQLPGELRGTRPNDPVPSPPAPAPAEKGAKDR